MAVAAEAQQLHWAGRDVDASKHAGEVGHGIGETSHLQTPSHSGLLSCCLRVASVAYGSRACL